MAQYTPVVLKVWTQIELDNVVESFYQNNLRVLDSGQLVSARDPAFYVNNRFYPNGQPSIAEILTLSGYPTSPGPDPDGKTTGGELIPEPGTGIGTGIDTGFVTGGSDPGSGGGGGPVVTSSSIPTSAAAILAKTEVTFAEAKQALADIAILIETVAGLKSSMLAATAAASASAAAIAILRDQVSLLISAGP